MSGFLDGIWAAVPTPFASDGGLDLTGCAGNAAYYGRRLGLAGIFCNGLIGEGWALSVAERKRVLEAVIAGAGGQLRVGVVTTHHSLEETVELSRHAARAGADHIVLTRPSAPFSMAELSRFVEMAAAAADVPVVLFDGAAATSGFPRELIATLGEQGTIAAVKSARELDSINELRAYCGDHILVADPYEAHWLDALIRFGRKGLYADPEPYLFQTPDCQPIRDYASAFLAGDMAMAVRLHHRLEPLRRLYERWILADLRRGVAVSGVLKHWCARLGLAAGPPRAPVEPLSRERAALFDAELERATRAVIDSDPVAPSEVAAWKS